MSKSTAKKIIIAGGGTGGHLFPGIAIAQAFQKKDRFNLVLFIGTGKSFEKKVTALYGFEYASIVAEGIKRRGLVNQIKALLKIPIGIYQTLMIFQKFYPDIVIGVGGYSSGPVALAAKIKKIPIVLQEQNILPGMTNRILSKISSRIYVSFKHTQGLNPKKIIWTGNPVRNEILSVCHEKKTNNHLFTVLVLGGSQGAHAINLAVTESLSELKSIQQRFHFIHQTGTDDEAYVKNAYESYGISHTVAPFFHDMPVQYQMADLVICRAGATTVAELTAIGKPAIFIPFPFAADNHQELNARSLLNEHAADMILQQNISGKILAEKIMYYESNPTVLDQIASQAAMLGKPNAAMDIVEDCYKIMG